MCNPGEYSIVEQNNPKRLADGLILIVDAGIPLNISSSFPNNCANNKVIVVNKRWKIVWQYKQADITRKEETKFHRHACRDSFNACEKNKFHEIPIQKIRTSGIYFYKK